VDVEGAFKCDPLAGTDYGKDHCCTFRTCWRKRSARKEGLFVRLICGEDVVLCLCCSRSCIINARLQTSWCFASSYPWGPLEMWSGCWNKAPAWWRVKLCSNSVCYARCWVRPEAECFNPLPLSCVNFRSKPHTSNGYHTIACIIGGIGLRKRGKLPS